ncbi:hypothetical protein PAP18089_00321 [Pandoraea apista]|uniref:Uncharacterized protein n=1 Tax=Pandoraea apista TaxID=93218 RepID=A0A5E5NYK3_9BURK|nr:hypothetical protein LMG16407_01952 [Pandoraea apista]VVG69368.1 hypothetical protein PAP18089_00321 [Pandoraea apista]
MPRPAWKSLFAAVFFLPGTVFCAEASHSASCEETYLKVPCDNHGAYTCRQKYRELASCQQAERREREEKQRQAKAKSADANEQAVQLVNKANSKLRTPSGDHAPAGVVSPRLNDHTSAPREGGQSF